MDIRRNILLGISVIITVLLITIGISYAYFTANLTGGEETTTITVTGGTMNIVYNGGANINLVNIIPGNNQVTTKTFTVTGNNTTDVEMLYQISLIVESNTFSEDALKYKLISTNTNNNGTIVPTIATLTNIGTGSKTIKLGVGEFTSPTGGNKVHTYNLEIYFPNEAYNQNIDQGKEIKAYIKIENYVITPVLLKDSMLAQAGGATAVEGKGTPNFYQISTSTDTGLYAADDEYGTSYYYRGDKDILNNNLIYGGFQWKIIRSNGDESIRIIYNGTEENFNTNGTMNMGGAATQISGTVSWNTFYNTDAKYLGYMYGGANGVASTVRNGSTSAAATYNETSSNAKAQVDAWYLANISGKPYESKLVDNLFCNDRRLNSEVGGAATGPGYGNTTTYYASKQLIEDTKSPTLKCGQKNDRFTVSDTTIGNGSLTYPVGLMTGSEAAMAGMIISTTNPTNYLNTNQDYWLSTPGFMIATSSPFIYKVSSNGSLGQGIVTGVAGIRPVLNLSSEVKVTGDGSATNPYRVQI